MKSDRIIRSFTGTQSKDQLLPKAVNLRLRHAVLPRVLDMILERAVRDAARNERRHRDDAAVVQRDHQRKEKREQQNLQPPLLLCLTDLHDMLHLSFIHLLL